MTALETSDSAVEFLIRSCVSATRPATRRLTSRTGCWLSPDRLGSRTSRSPRRRRWSRSRSDRFRQRTFTVRVRPSAVDLDAIARVDDLVQDVVAERLDADGALTALAHQSRPLQRPWPVLLAAYAIAGAALTPVLGGGWHEIAASAVVGLLVGAIALRDAYSTHRADGGSARGGHRQLLCGDDRPPWP